MRAVGTEYFKYSKHKYRVCIRLNLYITPVGITGYRFSNQ
jgi:hypothetical protein